MFAEPTRSTRQPGFEIHSAVQIAQSQGTVAVVPPPQEKGTVFRYLEVMNQRADYTMDDWPNLPNTDELESTALQAYFATDATNSFVLPKYDR